MGTKREQAKVSRLWEKHAVFLADPDGSERAVSAPDSGTLHCRLAIKLVWCRINNKSRMLGRNSFRICTNTTAAVSSHYGRQL